MTVLESIEGCRASSKVCVEYVIYFKTRELAKCFGSCIFVMINVTLVWWISVVFSLNATLNYEKRERAFLWSNGLNGMPVENGSLAYQRQEASFVWYTNVS